MSGGIYITGTDTGAGKTFVTAGLLRALSLRRVRAVGMKPVAAGVDAHGINDDVAKLRAVIPPEIDSTLINPYCFAAPTAPEFAAEQERRSVQWPTLDHAYRQLEARAERVLVEGVGGWRVPLNRAQRLWQSDLAQRWQLSVLLVVGIKLGAINHALLTAEAILRDMGQLTGWIANIIDPNYSFAAHTIALLEEEIESPCLGHLEWQDDSNGAVNDRRLTEISHRLVD